MRLQWIRSMIVDSVDCRSIEKLELMLKVKNKESWQENLATRFGMIKITSELDICIYFRSFLLQGPRASGVYLYSHSDRHQGKWLNKIVK